MKLFLSLSFLAFASLSLSQTSLISEDFSSGFPAGWTTIDVDGNTPSSAVSFVSDAWVVAEDIDAVGSGDSVLISTSYYDNAGTSDDWVITSALSLGAFGNKLSWKAKSYDGSFADGYSVYWANDAVIDSFLVNDPLFEVTAETTYWTDYLISLDSAGASGQTIYLAFVNNSTNQFLLGIDDINVVTEVPISVNEEAEITAVLYPNPMLHTLNISGVSGNISTRLFDGTGRLVLITNGKTIDVSELSAGIYVAEIASEQGVVRRILEKE